MIFSVVPAACFKSGVGANFAAAVISENVIVVPWIPPSVQSIVFLSLLRDLEALGAIAAWGT